MSKELAPLPNVSANDAPCAEERARPIKQPSQQSIHEITSKKKQRKEVESIALFIPVPPQYSRYPLFRK